MAVGPGGATSRRRRPQPEQGPQRRSAAVEQGSQTGPSGQVVAGGRASPQRAQTRVRRGRQRAGSGRPPVADLVTDAEAQG
jgi:hypothetical protein